MERFGKLLFLMLVVAAVSFGGWLLFGSVSVDGTTSTEEVAEQTSGSPAELAVAHALGPDEPARRIERTTVPVSDVGADRDPEILASMARFTGRVVHRDGKPAAQRLVRFYRFDPRVVMRPATVLFDEPVADYDDVIAGEATTGEDGRFELAGVWPHAVYLVKADAVGPAPTLRIADRTPGPAETVDLGDIMLKDAATVVGRVVDEDGEPVVGATVRGADVPALVTQFVPVERFDPEGWLVFSGDDGHVVIRMPGWAKRLWRELPVPTTTTDAEGRFKLEGLDPGMNVVAAIHPGLCPAVQKNVKLDPGETRDIGQLVLREGEIAAGRVVDAAGKPVAGAQVLVGNRLHMPPIAFARETTSDARGQFECKGLGAGSVIAAARRGPDEPWAVTAPQPIEKDLLITLPTQHALTVRVLAGDGSVIANPELRLLHFGAEAEDEVPMLAAMGLANTVALAGRERRLEDGRIRIADLDAATYVVLASGPGHAPGHVSVELDRDREVEVKLVPEATLDVLVVDGEDQPIRNAAVYVELHGPGPQNLPVAAGHTGVDGRVTVRRGATDRAVVEASHPKYGSAGVDVEAGANAPIVIRLAAPASIEGEVVEHGRPPEPGKYMVVAHRSYEEARGPVSQMPAITTLDLEGKFALRGLQPGKWRVEAVQSFQDVTSFGALFEKAVMARVSAPTPEEVVELRAGQTVQVRLDPTAERVVDGPSARVAGTVFVDGKPGEGMVVHGWNAQQLSAVVDASGRFDLGQVREGNVFLHLADRTSGLSGGMDQLWSRMIEVHAGKDMELEIDVKTASLVGLVLDRVGSPAPGVMIQANGVVESGEGGTRGFTVTDDDGRFELKRLAAGRYKVSAHGAERGRAIAMVTKRAGEPGELRLQLGPTYSVKGRVDRKSLPLPAKDSWLGLHFELQAEGDRPAGSESSWANVTADGTYVAEHLLPGRYRVRILGSLQGEWVHDGEIRVTDRDLEVDIVPVRVEPDGKARAEGGRH